MDHTKFHARSWRPLLLAATVCLAAGCPQPSRPAAAPAPANQPLETSRQQEQQQADQFQQAIGNLEQLHEFDPVPWMQKIAYFLNRWSESFRPAEAALAGETWRPDPLLETLPAEYRGLPPLAELESRHFTLDDVRYLREVFWLRGLAKWVPEQKAELEIKPWLEELEKSRGAEHAQDVETAARLFDWTIRNIQLLPLAPEPERSVTESATRFTAIGRGVPGPGYTQFVWQTLMLGEGDAQQRAAVFIGALRQAGLDAVLLAVPQAYGRVQPWLPGVLIGDSIYLFEPQLGLPIPGPNGVGIATLKQARENGELLRWLAVGGKYPYAAAQADLSRIVALIDAPPASLTRRMDYVESQLNPQQKMTLAVWPSRVVERLHACEGMSGCEARLWTVPIETWLYRTALDAAAAERPDLRREKIRREWFLDLLHPLTQGRQLHLLGDFTGHDEKDGAKALYLKARLTDVEIRQIETSAEIQQRLGLIRGRQSNEEWAAALGSAKYFAGHAKMHANYWLGLAHYDTGDYAAARDWLGKRTLDRGENNPWPHGARFNLALTQERLGDLPEARRLLLLDDSPQAHGNLIRARELKKRLPDDAAAPPTETNSAGT